MNLALRVAPLAQSGERPVLRVVRADWRHGDLKVRVRRGRCADCRCRLAQGERRCRACFSPRAAPRAHARAAPCWADDFAALRMHAARSNWPADRGSKRVSRARDPDSKEDVRVTIVLTKADEEYALGRLLTWPTRRFFDRWEWLSAAWIELVSPPDGIETPSQIDVMLKRAVWRAEKKIRADK